jgi:hypothetical protein
VGTPLEDLSSKYVSRKIIIHPRLAHGGDERWKNGPSVNGQGRATDKRILLHPLKKERTTDRQPIVEIGKSSPSVRQRTKSVIPHQKGKEQHIVTEQHEPIVEIEKIIAKRPSTDKVRYPPPKRK